MILKKVIYLIVIVSIQFLSINFLSAQVTDEKIEEEMPRFPGCENQGLSSLDLKVCAENKMLKFMYSNLKYPSEARENGIEGRVIVQFVVDIDGSITNAKIARDLPGGCGEEVLRIINSMPKWLPGKSRGKPVKVRYHLPFTFKLEGKKKEKKKKKRRWF